MFFVTSHALFHLDTAYSHLKIRFNFLGVAQSTSTVSTEATHADYSVFMSACKTGLKLFCK